MDWLTIAIGAASFAGGFAIGWRVNILDWLLTADALEADRATGWEKLHALRDNCFITNAKGHRVRYNNATPDERARAEGND